MATQYQSRKTFHTGRQYDAAGVTYDQIGKLYDYSIVATQFNGRTKSNTPYSGRQRTLTIGSPIGLLLALTYSASQTIKVTTNYIKRTQP